MATRSARDIAAEIRLRLPGVPKKKLHKLLYYCQGHHAATFGTALFAETISAWDMGPVVGELWWEEKQADGLPQQVGPRLDEAELNTIGYVISRYGKLSGRDLEHLTHSESPWLEANETRRAAKKQRAKIQLDVLIDFFSQDDSEADDAEEPSLDADEVRAWLEGAQGRSGDTLSEDTPQAVLARF